MAERYLTGAIQKNGRLTDESVRFLQIGCGIDFKLPTGRQRISVVENLPLRIGIEKNGGLAEGVAVRKYSWAIAGLDMLEGLPDELRDQVIVVKKLGFQRCQYTLGVWESALEKFLLIEGKDRVETLEDLRPGTRIATKPEHEHALKRIVGQRGLNLPVVHDPTPETAPELRGIDVVADIVRTGGTFREFHLSQREVLLESEAVLIKAKRLPYGMKRIFYDELLPRVDQALEHPERWLNPDTLRSLENGGQDYTRKPEQRFWGLGRLFHGAGRSIAVASTLPMASLMTFFTLSHLLVILNPWHWRTSKEKDSRN